MKKTILLLITLTGALVFQNCSSTRKMEPKPEIVTRTYKTDIAPILQTACTPCHFPPDGKKEALNSYEAVKKHIGAILERVKLPQSDPKFMPFRMKKPPLNDSTINVLVQWQQQNMPE